MRSRPLPLLEGVRHLSARKTLRAPSGRASGRTSERTRPRAHRARSRLGDRRIARGAPRAQGQRGTPCLRGPLGHETAGVRARSRPHFAPSRGSAARFFAGHGEPRGGSLGLRSKPKSERLTHLLLGAKSLLPFRHTSVFLGRVRERGRRNEAGLRLRPGPAAVGVPGVPEVVGLATWPLPLRGPGGRTGAPPQRGKVSLA